MTAIENTPALWQKRLPRPRMDGHKYDRGHVAILGSELYTGATRLAAEASSRIGAGLVTVLADASLPIYQTALPADIMARTGTVSELNRINCLLAGPGGCTPAQAVEVRTTSDSIGLVLDAEAIALSAEISRPQNAMVITPHEGEFARYFAGLEGPRVERAMRVAQNHNAVCVLKGSNTIIASPKGDCRINAHASPWLAKAGTGDVLAGLIAGLLAQGMSAFDAASAAVWMHGDAGRQIGPGLTAPLMMPVLSDLIQKLNSEV